MARKKVIFVILEGPSDDAALALFFEKFFSDIPLDDRGEEDENKEGRP